MSSAMYMTVLINDSLGGANGNWNSWESRML